MRGLFKHILLTLLILVVFQDHSFGQQEDSSSVNSKRNYICLELGGKNLIYNFEYLFNYANIEDIVTLDLATGIHYGFNYHELQIPITQYFAIGKKKLKLEIGLNSSILFTRDPSDLSREEFFKEFEPNTTGVPYLKNPSLQFSISAGLRLYHKRWLFRLVGNYINQYPYTKESRKETWIPYAGVGIGININK